MKTLTINIIVAITLSIANQAFALTVMSINTDFLWDSREPHDGRIVGQRKPAPTLSQYHKELSYYTDLVRDADADIVGLIEIEGCHVAEKLARALGDPWSSTCRKGLDSWTGQDVALLTKMKTLASSNIKGHSTRLKGKKIRATRALTAVLTDGKETYMIAVAHLASKLGNNDLKRVAQAKSLKSGINAMLSKYDVDHKIILGDMNDTPNSDTLKTLMVGGYQNPARVTNCSYTYRNKCSLIDHILTSSSLAGGEFYDQPMSSTFSDHRAVIYKTGNGI